LERGLAVIGERPDSFWRGLAVIGEAWQLLERGQTVFVNKYSRP
jgi:hypothetical protein